MTVDDLVQISDEWNRYELVDGKLLASPPGSLTHQTVLLNIIVLIANDLERNPIGEVILSVGVVFDKYNSVIPDVIFMTNEQMERVDPEGQIQEAPELVVEVVSPGGENARRDRVVKLQVYSKFGVKEYWVADPAARTMEMYRREGDVLTLALTLKGDDEVTSPALPGFACEAGEFFGR